MKCKQHSSKLEWHSFSGVPLYIDLDTFELLSAHRYVLRAHEGIADLLSILSFYGDDSKEGNKCVPDILWLNNITVNVKILKAVIGSRGFGIDFFW